MVGRPATGLKEIILFRSGLPKVVFLHLHTGRDGKILRGMLREAFYFSFTLTSPMNILRKMKKNIYFLPLL